MMYAVNGTRLRLLVSFKKTTYMCRIQEKGLFLLKYKNINYGFLVKTQSSVLRDRDWTEGD